MDNIKVWVSSVVSAVAVTFAVFLFFEGRYASAEELQDYAKRQEVLELGQIIKYQRLEAVREKQDRELQKPPAKQSAPKVMQYSQEIRDLEESLNLR